MSGTGNPYADTREMHVIHTMFRREFALLPDLVRSVLGKDDERARAVVEHIELLCAMLHHHHSAEDAVLWPRLLIRAPKEIDPVVDLVEGHHRNIEELLKEAGQRLDAWRDGVDGDDVEALAQTLQRLTIALYEHMALEERLVLPVVERHIFASEWAEMARQAAASMAPDSMALVVGMVTYEGGREALPPILPEAVIDAAPQAYAAHAERVHGTPAPPRSTDVVIGTPFVGAVVGASRP